MFPGFAEQLRCYADVIVQFGLNLRPGQRVLLAEPYELQGVDPAATPLVEAIAAAVQAIGGGTVDTLWGDPALWREAACGWPHRGFIAQLERNTARVQRAIAQGDALIFPLSAQPGLAAGIALSAAARVRQAAGAHYAQIAPSLLAGRTNWTAAPAPTPSWAEVVFADAPAGARLARLWAAVFAACRADRPSPLTAWRQRAATLEQRCAELNARAHNQLCLQGPGTDLVLPLARGHRWCTALLRTPDGRPFAPNLPTEEVFTAPEPTGAEGRLRVARPVFHAGAVMEGVELEFRRGEVVRARARRGADLLERVLATDRGACRLGEVAWVEGPTPVAATGRCFRQALLDENALHHVALGDGYGFTVATGGALNRSTLHLDLPVEAEARLS